MSTFLFVALLILNIIGAIWLGIKLGHFLLIPLAYIILLVIVGNTAGATGITIIFCIGAAITLILVIKTIYKEVELTEYIERIEKELLDAVNKGDVQTARELIEDGADTHILGSDDKSLLLIAVENSDKEMVSLLIENGADINKENPLVIAVRNNNKEIVELLLENGAKVNFILDGKSLLDMASDKEIIRILKKNGAKTKSEIDEEAWKTRQRYELQRMLNEDLITAVQKHEMSVAEKLISQGADVNYGTKKGVTTLGLTSLMFAIGKNDMEMIKFLLANGADARKEFEVFCYLNGPKTIDAISFARYVAKNENIANFLEHYM